jgi:hypothetical protein
VEGRGGEGDVRIRLAGLLPGLSRWSEFAGRSVPCELVDVRPHSFLKNLIVFLSVLFCLIERVRCERRAVFIGGYVCEI